ncbi:alpha/beta fold hydrolase [Chloroflexota bacterium]
MSEIKVGEISIYYESQGQGSPLVMVHGLGSSTRGWDYQVPYFSKNYEVITYDVRGHGQSGKPRGPYRIEQFAADLAGLLDVLGRDSVHLVGISMGGWIAFQFALDYPQMLKSLVLVNTWADMRPKNFGEWRELLLRLVIFRLLSMRKIGENLAPRLFIKPEQEELRQVFIEQWAENDKRAYMAAFQSSVGWSVADRLDQITCPALVISADGDYSTVESKQAYVDKMPNAKLVVIEDSRHATPVERPDEFNQVLGAFLRRVG